MSFKCNTSGLQGVADGEHDVRELIEYYSNSRTSSSLYRYREGSTRIGQTTPDRSTIKDRWEPYIPEKETVLQILLFRPDILLHLIICTKKQAVQVEEQL